MGILDELYKPDFSTPQPQRFGNQHQGTAQQPGMARQQPSAMSGFLQEALTALAYNRNPQAGAQAIQQMQERQYGMQRQQQFGNMTAKMLQAQGADQSLIDMANQGYGQQAVQMWKGSQKAVKPRRMIPDASGVPRWADDSSRVHKNAQIPNKAPTVKNLKQPDGSDLAVQWNPETSTWEPINAPIGGGGITPKGKLTESQSKLTLFRTMQTQTQPVLLDLEKEFNPANLSDIAAGKAYGGNFFKSQKGQIYDSAAAAWSEGALRIATGAAATPDEMARTRRTYFAVEGDTPQTIAFKAQMRAMYDRAIGAALGEGGAMGSLPLPSEFAESLGAGTQDNNQSKIDAIRQKYRRNQ